jgi:hypothetical protein
VITISPSGAKTEDEKRSDIQNDDDKKSQDDANKQDTSEKPKPDETPAPVKPENQPVPLSSLDVTLGAPDGKDVPTEQKKVQQPAQG